MARIRFEHVEKKYANGFHAVKDLNLDIQDREFLVLLGPSGCGKSTTLNMIAGLEEVSDGNLLFDDELVNYTPPHKRDVAMVFQSYALYPHKTVFDNIAFGLQMRKAPRAEIETRVRDAARKLEIEHLLDRRPSQLSGGQRQRLALARALICDRPLLLIDDGLSAVDVATEHEVFQGLQQRLSGKTVVIVSNRIKLLSMTDRILIFEEGKIAYSGRHEELLQHSGLYRSMYDKQMRHNTNGEPAS